MTRISQRLPAKVNERVFEFVLKIAVERKLLKGTTVAVDSNTLEANAAMRAIVRKDNGDDWKTYLKKLAAEEGVDINNDDDLRRYDQQRRKQGKKKVTNEEWESPTDPDARIGKMKDGRTHSNYKAEHVVDLDSEIIIQADVHYGNAANTETVIGNLVEAQIRLDHCFQKIESDKAAKESCGVIGVIEEVAADEGYHSNEVLKCCVESDIRTYIPERQGGERIWTDKDQQTKAAFHGNCQRMQRSKGKTLQKRRSELVERGFAHVCETGGARRTWLRGLDKMRKRHLISVAAYNLGLVMRSLFGFGKPRAFSVGTGLAALCQNAISDFTATTKRIQTSISRLYDRVATAINVTLFCHSPMENTPFLNRLLDAANSNCEERSLTPGKRAKGGRWQPVALRIIFVGISGNADRIGAIDTKTRVEAESTRMRADAKQGDGSSFDLLFVVSVRDEVAHFFLLYLR